MKDGIYQFRFSALGRRHDGVLRLADSHADGGDAIHKVQGQLTRAGANLFASFEIVRRPAPGVASLDDAPAYTIKMFGTGTETDFSVIGVGPLGLIVEIDASWKAAPHQRVARDPPETARDARPSMP